MKNLLLLIPSFFYCVVATSQPGTITTGGCVLLGANDTIPNSGFENWYYTPYWTIEADLWISNNSSIVAWNVIPDSNAYSGLLALRLVNYSYPGYIYSGFPLSEHPLQLSGYMKNGLALGDTAFIRIHVYSSGTLSDSGYQEIYGGIGTSYLPFNVFVSQNSQSADSCVISLQGGGVYASSISFDELSLSFPSVIEETNGGDMNVFPNPFNDKIMISRERKNIQNMKAELTDMSGRKIMEWNIAEANSILRTESLASGCYILILTDGETRRSLLISKNN